MEKAKRIFVALPISETLQEEVLQWEKQYKISNIQFPISNFRWLKGENLHVTLVPPWYENNIESVIDRLKKIKQTSFDMNFHTVSFGPDPKSLRLIWAEGRSDHTINNLQLTINEALGKQSEKRPFKLHLTLARFRQEDFKNFPIQKLHEPVSWLERVTKFVLMQSHLSSAGAEYEILESFPLS